MRDPTDSFPSRCLSQLAKNVLKYPRLFFYPQAFLFAASVFYTVGNLEFSTSRNDLVGTDKKYHTNYLQFKKEFAVQDELVAVVESEDIEKNRQFVERLGARLEAQTNLFTGVFYKGDLKMMGPKALLFLPEPTLRELHSTLKAHKPFLENFAQATNLNSLFRQVNQQFRDARRETNAQSASAFVEALPALRRIVEQAADSLDRPGMPPSPGVTALFDAGEKAEQGQYITFAEGRIYLVSARPVGDDVENQAVERLRTLVRQTQVEVPGVNVGVTGEAVLEFDEMRQSTRDAAFASAMSLGLVALLFVVAYRETGRPLKATICLLVGLGYTLGYATLAVGHLNILTVTFLPILIGLAIDFGIHLITRYEEELRLGRPVAEALEKAMVRTGLGIFTGCFTTAGAFFAMGLTDFRGIQEMGLITGGGMLICLVPMMTLLPVLLTRGAQNQLDHDARARVPVTRSAPVWLRRPGWTVGITFALCGLSLVQFPKVAFDYNLLNMQAKGLPAVEFEMKLIEGASKSVLFGAVIAETPDHAVRLMGQITNLSSVASVDSMSSFLEGEQEEKLEFIRGIKEALAGVCFPEGDTAPVKVPELSQTLFYTQSYLGLTAERLDDEERKVLKAEVEALQLAIATLRRRLAVGSSIGHSQKLASYQQALFRDLYATFEALKTQDDSAPLRVEDLPTGLRERFVGKSGKHLIQVYPKDNLWHRPAQETFITELRRIDPNVTGTPVQLFEYTRLLKDSYEEAAYYALGAISLLVLFHFKRISGVLLALLPVAIGMTWMAGVMGFLGLPFNPANIMTLPLVIGIGVTNGIHILNRFAEETDPDILAKSTGKAVLISGLTTMAGFGSLIPAKHQGIASLGMVMSLGVATCMLSAMAFLPALLALLQKWGAQTKHPVATRNRRHWVGRNRGV